jgi:hypothetical protein
MARSANTDDTISLFRRDGGRPPTRLAPPQEMDRQKLIFAAPYRHVNVGK